MYAKPRGAVGRTSESTTVRLEVRADVPAPQQDGPGGGSALTGAGAGERAESIAEPRGAGLRVQRHQLEVGLGEVVAETQQRLAGKLGGRVAEAVPVVQARRVTALAVPAERLRRKAPAGGGGAGGWRRRCGAEGWRGWRGRRRAAGAAGRQKKRGGGSCDPPPHDVGGSACSGHLTTSTRLNRLWPGAHPSMVGVKARKRYVPFLVKRVLT